MYVNPRPSALGGASILTSNAFCGATPLSHQQEVRLTNCRVGSAGEEPACPAWVVLRMSANWAWISGTEVGSGGLARNGCTTPTGWA
ncbi:MAG: hypothetical protein QOK05_2229 [Chloroflexota bacterium]|jgi:hypothetical protein|nr:hypothetical protein [Chloroflexota bacterium]